ncbi:MAG: SDR family oxidoreductase, partial [Spirochaetes bacterium]|nr:SDR family oxidoreductase [Spirochaetota bacterium]
LKGADVVFHYSRSKNGAEESCTEARKSGANTLSIQGDLSLPAECARVVDEAAAFLGGIDILVNNAGISKNAAFLDVSQTEYDAIFDLNMRGQFFCAQSAARYMKNAGGGSIVNISSVHAFGGVAMNSIYAGTKGAIVAFTRALAIELIPFGIRVNCVAPGHIEVERHFRMEGYSTESGSRSVPLGRVGTPRDIAAVVAFLVSGEAEFIVGQTLYVDGGLTAKLALSPRATKDDKKREQE